MNIPCNVKILCICAHPDDVELTMGGTVAKMVTLGHNVGIIDLTQGEMGTRGDVITREKEALEAAKVLGVKFRINCKMPDGWFENNQNNILKLIHYIRLISPSMVITNTKKDRHPDHSRCASMVEKAVFMSGLKKVETYHHTVLQNPHRPLLYFGIQSEYIKPDFVIDITPQWEIKLKSIRAFKSQFYDSNSDEPETFISNPSFLDFIESRAREFGMSIRTKYGEGFVSSRAVGIKDLNALI